MESDLNACSPKHMTIDEIQQEMSIVAEILQEYNGKLSLSQFSMMKNIFSIVPELFYVPKKLQLMVASMMRIRFIKQGETLISDTDTHPDAYVIAEGIFYNCLSTELMSANASALVEKGKG